MSQSDDLAGLYSAIETVWYRMYRLSRSTDLLNQADAIVGLSNAISDLASWHPFYDSETGEITEVFE